MDSLSKNPKVVEMALVHPNAAGIDIGGTVHAVAVPAVEMSKAYEFLVLLPVIWKLS
jgi:hypothetical protein